MFTCCPPSILRSVAELPMYVLAVLRHFYVDALIKCSGPYMLCISRDAEEDSIKVWDEVTRIILHSF